MTIICKLEFLGDAFTITRRDGTTGYKQQLTLRELGGKYADSYIATLFTDRICTLPEGTWLMCNLRFQTHTFEGQSYQDVVLQDYFVLRSPKPELPAEFSLPSIPQIPQMPTI